MCRTVHALLQTVICGIQMLVRVFMTVILMLENLIRMILQTLYNFISFLLQMLSLIPICVVFLLTARLKCFMCGGGGPCPVNRGGACDCIMSAMAILIMFLIFRATGILDKIFYSIGYTKAKIPVYRFVPTPGFITECSRNNTEYDEITSTLTNTQQIKFDESTLKYADLFKETETQKDLTSEYYDKFDYYYIATTAATEMTDLIELTDPLGTSEKSINNNKNVNSTNRRFNDITKPRRYFDYNL